MILESKLKKTMISRKDITKWVGVFILVCSATVAKAQSVGGTLTSIDTAKCATGNSGVITLSGQTGSVIRWEYSYSGGDPWTPIAVTSTSYNFSNLAQSISYRAVVQQPSFLPAYSSVLRVNVYNTSVAGSLSGPQNVCSGVSNLFQLSGKSGTVLNWEVSTNSGSTWNTIAASNDSIAKQLTSTVNSWYRANVKNGVCPTQTTPVFQVTTFAPTVSGTISGTDSICGNTNNTLLTLSGQTANELLWEYATAATGSWQSTGVTTSNYNFSNQTSTLYYRVNQKNGACATVYSPVFRVHHSNASVGGTISGVSYVCLNDTFSLTAVNYEGNILNWNYRLQGSGTWLTISSTSSILDFAIATAGNYEFAVTVKNGFCGSVMSQIKVLGIKDLPNASFTVSNTCEEVSVALSNTTSGNNLYTWDLGNGSSSNLQSPNVIYNTAGNYTIKLTATSSFGCVDSISHNVAIYAEPVIAFSTADSLCQQNAVTFTNLSTAGQGTISSYSWSDNGSAFSSVQNPSLLMSQYGDRVIRLQIVNSFGCSEFKDSTIVVYPKPNAGFAVNNVCFGETVAYQNQSSVNSGVLYYNWSFGDGNNSSLINPQHSFVSAGSYNTSLIVNTNYGCSDTAITTVIVNPAPTVDFTANAVCKSDSMAFIPSINGIANYTVNWTFGDGFQSTLQSPAHLYASFGTFGATLLVISDSSCSAQITKSVQVYPMPVANFSFTNSCEGTTVPMTNTSTLANGSFISEWSFDNGPLIQDFEPSHLFANGGSYPIWLRVTTDHNCIDTLTNFITIYESPVAAFGFSNTCNGIPVQFANQSTTASGSITQNMWDFGDGTNSTQQDPVKDYMNFGSYDVQLIVYSSVGCTDTITHTIQSYEQPIANFGVNAVCFGEETVFENQTVLSAGSFTSDWDFGDGGTSTVVSPSYEYGDPGNYVVRLAIMSDQGCPDTIIKPIVVYYLPVINAGNDTVTDRGIAVQLHVTGGSTYTWSPSAGLDNPQVAAPFANPDTTTTYIVYGVSSYGCVNSDTMTLTVNQTYKVIPYNVLTPDGNGKNDTWIIEYITSYPNNKVAVYNEMGHEIFTQKAYANTWDGKNKTGEILPDGTYYYILKFDDSDIEYKGEILLLRNL